MAVRLPNGERLVLAPGVEVSLGRAHAQGAQRAYVPREQLVACLAADGATLRVRAVGKRTAVADARGEVRATIEPGEEAELACGEGVGLLGVYQRVTFDFAAPSTGPPAAKRARTADEAVGACAAPAAAHAESPGAIPAAIAAMAASHDDEPYATAALLTRPYAPPPPLAAPEGLDALARLAADPSRALATGRALHADSRTLVLYDAYPKASVHLLLLPLGLPPSVRSAADLRPEHAPALRAAASCAGWLERSLRVSGALGRWRALVGLHRVPSMRPLHVHLLSAELRSERLKTKRHWNSFATPFFLPLDRALRELEATGCADAETRRAGAPAVERLLSTTPMVCPACSTAQGAEVSARNMPELKRHLESEAHAEATSVVLPHAA